MKLEGVVPILLAPFDEDGALDEGSLDRLVDFNVQAGVDGLGLALGSEIFKFSEAERDQLIRATVQAVGGRVPLVVNTSAAGTDLAVLYARAARDAGADALMIFPPTFMPVGGAEIAEYYSHVAGAVDLPIVLQDVPQAHISPGLAMRLATELDNVRSIKVETPPVTDNVAVMAAVAGDRLTIFGGAGGGYFVEELRRGARGTMPFASQPAAFVEIWNRFRAGDEPGAQAVFDAEIAPITRLMSQSPGVAYHLQKQLLVRLGILRTATVRSPAPQVDATTQLEMDQLIDELVTST